MNERRIEGKIFIINLNSNSHMKKAIVLFVAILAFAASSFAQSATNTETQNAPKTEKIKKHKGGKSKHAGAMDMKKELNLSSDQSNRIKNIGNTYKGKMQAIRTDNSLSATQKKAQMFEIHKAQDAEIRGVLDADQSTKFTEIKKQRRDKMKAHKGEYKGKGKKQGAAETAPKSN